jgi:hypothetical protein
VQPALLGRLPEATAGRLATGAAASRLVGRLVMERDGDRWVGEIEQPDEFLDNGHSGTLSCYVEFMNSESRTKKPRMQIRHR